MAYCPACETEWDEGMTECPICSGELHAATAPDESQTWELLGFVSDKISADYAKEVLDSYDIPAVVMSKSGFFGAAGLTLHSFYKPGSLLFEVHVPADYLEEAAGIIDMVLGDQWQRKE